MLNRNTWKHLNACKLLLVSKLLEALIVVLRVVIIISSNLKPYNCLQIIGIK